MGQAAAEERELEQLVEESIDTVPIAELHARAARLLMLKAEHGILDHRAGVLVRVMFALAVLITILACLPFGWWRVGLQLGVVGLQLVLFWLLKATVDARTAVVGEMIATVPGEVCEAIAERGPERMRRWARAALERAQARQPKGGRP